MTGDLHWTAVLNPRGKALMDDSDTGAALSFYHPIVLFRAYPSMSSTRAISEGDVTGKFFTLGAGCIHRSPRGHALR